MAMLAEPRKKQKFSLNPRGKQWTEDSNKFGQKMLEKFGWTRGKGLGVNEQGMVDPVKIKFKDDSIGIGYSKEDMDKNWIKQQENFNKLLEKLASSDDLSNQTAKKNNYNGVSLEKKSEQSRSRIHYRKFTRGKDVNQYSPKDLANIFGKKEAPRSNKMLKKFCSETPILNFKGSNIHEIKGYGCYQ